MPTSPLILAAILIVVAVYVTLRKRSRLPLPPGPRKLPLVGNLFDVRAALQYESYTRWSKEYNSDIIHLDLAGKSVVVLCSYDAAEGLLDERSSIYSDRDDLPMIKDLMGWEFNIATMKYGSEWRLHRRLLDQELNFKASRKYEPDELIASHKLLKRLLDTPDAFLTHLRQMAGELILSFTYGIDVLPSDDPYITLAEEALHTLVSAAVPGKYLVDTFPILRHIPIWFPGAGFKRQAREWRKLARSMLELPFLETKRQMESGIARSSFTADRLNGLKDTNSAYHETHIKATAATMYLGGADTTVSTLGTFILAMLANPEAQKKAQAEIDGVTAGESLPTFADRDSLPYVTAIVKEVLRWKNVTPFGGPRLLAVEDEYRGYRLPAGSLIIGSTWSILHDPIIYPDPHTFKPERFLLNGKLNPAIRDPEAAFGFGRRKCPGRHMATSSTWITIASILATFDINKAVDVATGRVIEPTYEYFQGVVNMPLPFECSIKPRSTQSVALVKGAAASSQ